MNILNKLHHTSSMITCTHNTSRSVLNSKPSKLSAEQSMIQHKEQVELMYQKAKSLNQYCWALMNYNQVTRRIVMHQNQINPLLHKKINPEAFKIVYFIIDEGIKQPGMFKIINTTHRAEHFAKLLSLGKSVRLKKKYLHDLSVALVYYIKHSLHGLIPSQIIILLQSAIMEQNSALESRMLNLIPNTLIHSEVMLILLILQMTRKYEKTFKELKCRLSNFFISIIVGGTDNEETFKLVEKSIKNVYKSGCINLFEYWQKVKEDCLLDLSNDVQFRIFDSLYTLY